MVHKMDSLRKMKQISIIWGIIIFSILITLIITSLMYKQRIKKYDALADSLEVAAREYVAKESLYPEANETIKVTTAQINQEKQNINLQINNDQCQGFVIVFKEKSVIKYKPYIKCPNYSTKNYNKY